MATLLELVKPEEAVKLEAIQAEIQSKLDHDEQKRREAWLAADKKKYETGGYFTSADEMISYVINGGTIYGEEDVEWGHLEPDQMRLYDDLWVAHFSQKSNNDVSFWFGWSFPSIDEWIAWAKRIASPEHLKYGKWLPTWHRDETREPLEIPNNKIYGKQRWI